MNLSYLEVDDALRCLRRAEVRAGTRARILLQDRLIPCWIFHDLSVEGDIFRDDELERALAGQEGTTWREDQLLVRVRHMRRAIQFVKRQASLKAPFSLEFVKEIHRQLRPMNEETSGRYRKDGGESSAYRHDIVAPKTISYRLRRLVAFVNSEELNGAFDHPIEVACHIHRELIEIFPFRSLNGLVARLSLNFWLLRSGYPPAIVLAQQRQRYFTNYLTDAAPFRRLVITSIVDGVDARVRMLDQLVEHSRIAA